MGKCENCDAEIDDKYKFCFKCSKALKDSEEPSKDSVVNQLEKNNNNLYKLTRQLDVLIREKYGVHIVWDKELHDFVEKVQVERLSKKDF